MVVVQATSSQPYGPSMSVSRMALEDSAAVDSIKYAADNIIREKDNIIER